MHDNVCIMASPPHRLLGVISAVAASMATKPITKYSQLSLNLSSAVQWRWWGLSWWAAGWCLARATELPFVFDEGLNQSRGVAASSIES